MQCLHESRLTIPFIVVSHAIGEEEAVELMRKGAADYLLKDRMARLGEAVRHGLEERQLRSKFAEAQEELWLLNQELENRIVERTTELEVANRALARELSERKQIEERLRQLAGTLEERVKERTQQLSTSYIRLRALATDLTVAEQTERRRLATDLHDYLAQMLVVTRMKVAQLLRQDHDPDVRTILQDADQLLHQSLDYTRSLVSELTPQALYERGLGAALRWLADQMRRQADAERRDCLSTHPSCPFPRRMRCCCSTRYGNYCSTCSSTGKPIGHLCRCATSRMCYPSPCRIRDAASMSQELAMIVPIGSAC